MSLQSLQRQLNAITQKLEAIHSDIHQAPLAARSKGQALPNSGTGSPRVGRSLTSFVDNDAPTRPVGRMNSNNGEEILIPQPPPKGPRDCTSPETTRPGRGASAVLIKDAFPEPIPRDPNNVSPGASLGVVVLEESIGRGSRLDSSVNSTSTENAPRQSPQSGSLEKGDKKKSAILKQARDQFFAKYEFRGKWNEIPKAQGVSCVWLACAAIAVEFVTGVATTMEMFMVTNHLAVHYVSFPSVTLAELYDTVDEYLIASGHTSQGNRCEIATFDRITIDDVGDEMGMGERLPVMTLAAFRKELSRLESHSILIFNYDPFVVQEAEMVLQELEDEEEEGSIKEKKVDTPEQWAAKNQGNFALMLQFNSALHTVTIGTPQLGPDGVYRMETHTVSLQTMYTACCVKDGYTNKSRGFVRVFRDRSDSRQIPSLFPITLLDGRDAGGLLSSSLDVAIAPHILGLSFLHHLVQATLLNDRARRRQSTKSVSDVQLRGIPVTKVCHVLGLPVGAVVGGSSKDSIACAFAWYKIFLAKLGIQNDVHLGIITINRKGGTEDGAVNITDEHFLSDVSLAVSSKSVMLVAFDVNVALNVAVETRGDPCHFAIVVGIDESHGIVKLADVSVKKYRKVWHVPITRLYNATIQYGYIVASASPDVIERLGCSKFVDSILNQARYRLPAYSHFSRFEYPVKNYTITVLADAFDRLGFPNSNVESFVHNAGFHVSFLLSEHIPLEGAVRIASFYSHTVLLDEMRVTAKHYDNREVQTLDGFCQDLREALARNDALLLVNFQTTTIQKVKEVWNGGNGGSLAIVTNFNEADGNVTVCDANFSAYYRTWSVPVGVLYDAITQVDRICGRARGTLLLEKAHQTLYDDTRGYDQRRAMVHHPFKPTISTTAATIALAASEMMQKSYSQEQFLYNTLEFNLCKFTTRAADVDAVVADANHAFRQLNVQLIAVALPCSTPDELQAAINGTEGLLSVTIVLYNTDVMHKTTGLGNGAAVVNNRGEGGIVKLVDGNPTVFGDFWEASLEALHASVLGVLVVRGQGDDMES